MARLIIVDGVDGVGKGYLISKISKLLPTAIVIKICDRPKNSSEQEREKIKIYYARVWSAIMSSFQDNIIIMDRFFPSEIVYSIKRGYESFDDLWFKEFEDLIIDNVSHLYVHVIRNKEEIEKSFNERGEEYITTNDIDILSERYQKFFDQTNLNKIQITSNEYEKVIHNGKY